jgi:hypothetical protein
MVAKDLLQGFLKNVPQMGRFKNDEFMRLVLDFGYFAASADEQSARYWFIQGRNARFPEYV